MKKKTFKWNLNHFENYILLYGSFLIYSASAICAKLASGQKKPSAVLLFIGLEICCLGIYALVWQKVLKRFTLITAMSSKGIVVIFNLIWSVIFFKESITVNNMIGAVIIMWGIWVVSADE